MSKDQQDPTCIDDGHLDLIVPLNDNKLVADRHLPIRLANGRHHSTLIEPPVSLREDNPLILAARMGSLIGEGSSRVVCSNSIPIGSSQEQKQQQQLPACCESADGDVFSSSYMTALTADDAEKLYNGATWRMYHLIQSSRQPLSANGKDGGAGNKMGLDDYRHYLTHDEEQPFAHVEEEGESALGIFDFEINS